MVGGGGGGVLECPNESKSRSYCQRLPCETGLGITARLSQAHNCCLAGRLGQSQRLRKANLKNACQNQMQGTTGPMKQCSVTHLLRCVDETVQRNSSAMMCIFSHSGVFSGIYQHSIQRKWYLCVHQVRIGTDPMKTYLTEHGESFDVPQG